jgi:hypothetical protein
MDGFTKGKKNLILGNYQKNVLRASLVHIMFVSNARQPNSSDVLLKSNKWLDSNSKAKFVNHCSIK